MIDGIISGNGTSRLLRSVNNFKTLYPTYDDFAAALISGALPIDILFNESGWDQVPDFLNKGTLISDETAALYPDLPDNPVPDDVFKAIGPYYTKRKILNTVTADQDGFSTILEFGKDDLAKKLYFWIVPSESGKNLNETYINASVDGQTENFMNAHINYRDSEINFDSYQIALFGWAPIKINVFIMEYGGDGTSKKVGGITIQAVAASDGWNAQGNGIFIGGVRTNTPGENITAKVNIVGLPKGASILLCQDLN